MLVGSVQLLKNQSARTVCNAVPIIDAVGRMIQGASARFRIAKARLGLGDHRADLDIAQFRPPSRDGQMALF